MHTQNKKRHPTVFGFKAGCVRMGFLSRSCSSNSLSPCAGFKCRRPAHDQLQNKKKLNKKYTHSTYTICLSRSQPPPIYFKRSMSSWVRPKFSSCIGVSWARWGKDLSRRSQHSSSRLGTTSQILNKEPVRLFSWMFTTPPWMYMQPAWEEKKKK